MMVKIGEKRVNFERAGVGKPILFVHGWGGTIASLKPLYLLAAKKYQVFILDLPGFGRSDNPDPSWGVEEYSRLLVDFLKRVGIEKINYFGHSFGGSLGIFLAANYPQAIEKLILCDSSFKRLLKVSQTAKKLKKISQYLPFFPKFEPQIKRMYYRIFFPDSDLIKFPQLESNFRKIMTQDLTDCLGKINKQTLILWGENDKDTPVELAHELQEKIANSQLKIFPNVGHGLPLDCPNIIFQELRRFI